MADYILGVDGGNTKCDFLLFTAEGRLADVLRTGTCSHENLSGGYDEADALMRRHMDTLLSRNGLQMADIRAAGMGLAGVDLPDQRDALLQRIRRWGMGDALDARNDAVLGIKAGSPTGSGVCCVNGTGTVVVGMDDENGFLQIGGLGGLTGDLAGGHHAAARVCCAAYDQLYRGYPRTALADAVLALLGIAEGDYMMAAHKGELTRPGDDTRLNILAQQLANDGDPAARAIYDDMGERLGRSAACCIRRLRWHGPITVVLAGSVFIKCSYPGLRDTFARYLREGVGSWDDEYPSGDMGLSSDAGLSGIAGSSDDAGLSAGSGFSDGAGSSCGAGSSRGDCFSAGVSLSTGAGSSRNTPARDGAPAQCNAPVPCNAPETPARPAELPPAGATSPNAAQSPTLRIEALTVPPCVGAVLWARQLLLGRPLALPERESILAQLTNEKYEQIVFA